MLTQEEILKFASLLDKEYADEVKPMLISAGEAINKVLNSTVNSAEYLLASKRYKSIGFNFGYLPSNLRSLLADLHVRGDESNYHRITVMSLHESLVSKLGFSGTVYNSLCSLFNSPLNEYGKNPIRQIETIARIKEEINSNKKAYESMFIADNGKNFREFISVLTDNYNKVMARDSQADDEIRALFNSVSSENKIRISLTIEKI